MMKKFALIGAAGYVAPRHLKAIEATGNILVAALDKFDSVGILDSYFPNAHFFTEFERFDRHIDKIRRQGNPIDFLSICTPNYLHDAHIRFGLRNNMEVICEKPLVLNPWNVTALEAFEQEAGKNVYTILQLRHHPSILALKNRMSDPTRHKKQEVDLTYITSRGNWYQQSWKGVSSKAGGIATNIGIHFFDMLIWVFGAVQKNVVHVHKADHAAGFLELERARVRWFLSISSQHLPAAIKAKGQRTFRSIKVAKEEIEFSAGFTDLHTVSYEEILAGRGYRIADARPSIELVYDIRNATVIGIQGDYHPLARQANQE